MEKQKLPSISTVNFASVKNLENNSNLLIPNPHKTLTVEKIDSEKENILEMAKEFLEILAINPDDKQFHFQTYADSKIQLDGSPTDRNDRRLTMTTCTSLPMVQNQLIELSRNGAGIFTTINKTNGNSRRAADITTMRAVFVDQDDGELPNIDELPIKPTMVTGRSERNWHMYWLIDPQITKEQWYEIQAQLTCYFGSDPAMVDTARVLRIPGFFHQKNPQEHQQYVFLYKNEDLKKRYTYKEIKEAFKLSAEQQEISDLLSKRKKSPKTSVEVVDLKIPKDDEANFNLAQERIDTLLPAAISGKNGQNMLYRACCICWDSGISLEQARKAIITSKWCLYKSKPAWDYEKDKFIIEHHLASVYIKGYAKNKFGQKSIENMFNLDDFAAEDNTTPTIDLPIFQINKITGAKLKNTHNITCYFHKAYNLDNLIYWDEMSNRIMIEPNTALPWAIYTTKDGSLEAEVTGKEGRGLTDEDLYAIKNYISSREYNLGYNVNYSTEMVHEALVLVAKAKRKHPVVDYLQNLKWDGKNRIESLFHYYCGAEENEYTKQVARYFLLGAVKRVCSKEPVKIDYVPVLESEQGVGKSTFAQILGKRKWTGEVSLDFSNRKAMVEALSENWINEIAEHSSNHKDVEAFKGFLSQLTDTQRGAYKRNAEKLVRKYVFISTINPKDKYLKDVTGNRRLHPIKVTQIKLEELERDIDQIWGEAYERAINRGEKWYPTFEDRNFHELAKKEQEQRREIDEWYNNISEWWETNKKELIKTKQIWTTSDVHRHIFSGSSEKLSRVDSLRIASVLRNEMKWREGTHRCPIQKRVISGFKPEQDIRNIELEEMLG